MKLDEAIYTTVTEGIEFDTTKLICMLYYNLFGKWPLNTFVINPEEIIDMSVPYNNEPNYHDFPMIDLETFNDEIIQQCYVRCELDYDDVYVNQEKEIVLMLTNRYIRVVFGGDIIDLNTLTNLQSFIKLRDVQDDKIEIGILVQRNGSYYVDDTEIDIMGIDVDRTYNDDIPEEAINDFVNKERNGLMLFYGEPGTGKTTYIRHLIQENRNKKFVILDSNLLYNITSHSLLNVFIDKKDAIYIIEDCEKLLVSRDNETNPIISAFLNMTDGILANIINCKFICTFNTDLSNVDEALKRKGRMKLKYEFKKLAADKVKKILNDDNANEMTIADVVYNEKQNDYSEKKKRKIGFNVT